MKLEVINDQPNSKIAPTLLVVVNFTGAEAKKQRATQMGFQQDLKTGKLLESKKIK